jgi:hypothetical protein
MLFRFRFVIIIVAVSASCGAAEPTIDASTLDAGPRDASSSDASRVCRPTFGADPANAAECPCGLPIGNGTKSCPPTTAVCRYSADCARGGRIVGVTGTARCLEGSWHIEWPDFCHVSRDQTDADEEDGG